MTGLHWAWWNRTADALSHLFVHATGEAEDRDAEEWLKGSILFGIAHGSIALAERAWSTSSVRRGLITLSASTKLAGSELWRFAGAVAAVSATTAIAATFLGAESAAPSSLLLPAAIAIGGLLVMAAAPPLARARRDKLR